MIGFEMCKFFLSSTWENLRLWSGTRQVASDVLLGRLPRLLEKARRNLRP